MRQDFAALPRWWSWSCIYRVIKSVESAQELYSDGCWLLPTWLSGCRECQNAKRAVAVLKLRAPLEAGGSPMVCMSAGFAMLIPGSWTSRNHLRLEAWLGPHFNTLFPNYIRCQQCHLSWSRRLYTSGQESRLDGFLSKAQLSDQSLSISRTTCLPLPQRSNVAHTYARRQEKICISILRYSSTHARKMHGCRATSLHPTRSLFSRSRISLQALILDLAGPNFTHCTRVPYAMHLFGPVAEAQPRRPQLYQAL